MSEPLDPRAHATQNIPDQHTIPRPASPIHESQPSDTARLAGNMVEKIENLTLHESIHDLTKTRLSRNSHVLINQLPKEILGEIFYLVLCCKPCRLSGWDTVDKPIEFPEYPDRLTHVCGHWRDVAISLRALWSHIDLAPFDRVQPGLVARACVFADRAGDAPLHVHLTYASDNTEHSAQLRWKDRNILKPIRHRIRSMEMNIESPVDEQSNNPPASLRCILAIDTTLAYLCVCAPGVLSQCTIVFNWRGKPRLVPFGLVDSDWANPSPVRGQQGVLYGLTVLRLEEAWLFPLPRAYQNLIELHIISTHDMAIPIPEDELVKALRSCPGLQIFRFNHPIIDQLDSDVLTTPIRFDNLELLVLELPSQYLDSLIRWIMPGPGPLRLSICPPSPTSPILQTFLGRSDILHLRLRFPGPPQLHHNIVEPLSHTTHLQDLSIYGSFIQNSIEGLLEIPLDTLYLLDLDISEIGLPILGIRADKIVVWRCKFTQPEGHLENSQNNIHQHLSQFSPKIEFAQGEYPVRGWGQ